MTNYSQKDKKIRVIILFCLTLLTSLIFVGCFKENNSTSNHVQNKKKSEKNQSKKQRTELELSKVKEENINLYLKEICKSPRKSGSKECIESMEWLNKTLKKWNYQVEEQPFEVYKQSLETDRKDSFFNLNPYKEKNPIYKTSNLIAVSKANELKKKTLIISAHYDTTSDTKGVVDNGSGVAAVLGIAEALKDVALPFNIKFIFFGSEEYHVYGSKYYLSQLKEAEKKNIIGCINIDMIGDAAINQSILGTIDGTENQLTLELTKLNKKQNTSLKTWKSIGLSDDFSFYKMGIPSILVSDIKINPKGWEKDAPISAINIERLAKTINELIQMITQISLDPNQFENNEINIKSLNSLFQADDIVKQSLEGYELIGLKEKLFDNGLGSQVIYTFENNEKLTYQIIQHYKETFDDQFNQIEDDYLLIKDGEKSKLIINNVVITEIIGNMNQLKKLALIWDIKI